MKTKSYSVWMYTAMIAVILVMASCGNSQKKKEREAERAERRTAVQQPTETVVETETMIIAVDSLAPDSTNNRVTPRRTK